MEKKKGLNWNSIGFGLVSLAFAAGSTALFYRASQFYESAGKAEAIAESVRGKDVMMVTNEGMNLTKANETQGLLERVSGEQMDHAINGFVVGGVMGLGSLGMVYASYISRRRKEDEE